MTWCDLEADRPWFDECAAADAEQDRAERDAARIAAQLAAIAAERFGPLDALAAELDAPPPHRTAPRYLVRPAWLRDDDLAHRRRRRTLMQALPMARPVDHQASVC